MKKVYFVTVPALSIKYAVLYSAFVESTHLKSKILQLQLQSSLLIIKVVLKEKPIIITCTVKS